MSEVQLAEGEEFRLENEAAAGLVKSRDRERYWSTLFAPADKQPALLALYAFNAELDHIAAAAREPMVGQIRLQWWRDAVELVEPGMKTGNPIADALSAAILAHDLPKARLAGMIAARIPEITGDAPASLEDLRASLLQTEGAVFELAASILVCASEAGKRGCPARGAGLWAYAKAAHGPGSGIEAPVAAASVLPSEPRRGCGLGLRGQNEHRARRRPGRFQG